MLDLFRFDVTDVAYNKAAMHLWDTCITTHACGECI